MAAQREVLSALFGADHPYANGGEPVPWTWQNITRFDLLDFARKHYVGKNATLAIVGVVDPAQVRKLVETYFAGIPAGAPSDAIPPVRPVRPGAIGLVIPDSPAATDVALGWPAGAYSGDQLAARLVAARMLDRRLHIVRESLAASYHVEASLLALSGGGVYLARGSIDGGRVEEAIRAMRKQAAGLAAGERLEADFVRARREVIHEIVAGATASAELARSIEALARAGNPDEQRRLLVEAVAGVTVAEVREVLARDLHGDREAIVVAGERPFLEKVFAAAGVTNRTLRRGEVARAAH
jgi:zinc protease